MFLSRSWRNGVSANADFDTRWHSDGSTETGAFLSLRWSFGQANHSLTASHDTTSDTSNLDYQYFSPRIVGGLDGTASFARTPDSIGADGIVQYRGYRGEATLRQSFVDRQDSGRTGSRTRLNLGTALLYADGEVAVSRPISDSFVIAKKHKNLDGQVVGLDQIDGVYSAKADALGNGVIPNLSSYQARTVSINAPDLPFGYELGPDHYTVKPGYRSGIVLRIGTDATVMLIAQLIDTAGEPVALEAGIIQSTSDPGAKISFFTNRTGRLVGEGLKPGTYAVRLLSDDREATVTIPDSTSGILRIEYIRIAPPSPEESPP